MEGGYSKADMRKKISEHLCKTDYSPDLSEIAPIPYEVAKSPWNHIKGVTNQQSFSTTGEEPTTELFEAYVQLTFL
jgi:hypothetical protein